MRWVVLRKKAGKPSGYFFSDILREISASSRGRRSARTLSTMLATSAGFSLAVDGRETSCAICSAPAATAIAASTAATAASVGWFSFGAGCVLPLPRTCRQLAHAAAELLIASDSPSLCAGGMDASDEDEAAIAGSTEDSDGEASKE